MKVVVVGGGFGGTKAALELANKPDFSVTLINPTGNFEYHGGLYRTATGHSPLEVVLPLRDIFQKAKNVEVILDKIVSIEPQKRRVVGGEGNIYPYDAVVLAMGNEVNHYGADGAGEHSYSLDNVKSTIALRHELVRNIRGPKKHLKVAIVGAGASAVELAAELQPFADTIARKQNIQPKKLEIFVIDGASRVMPAMGEKVSRKVQARLEKLGINVILNTRVNSCEPGKLCLEGGDLKADIVVWLAGSQPVDFYAKHRQFFELERGKVKVDEHLQAEELPGVYVIGDNAATPYSGMAQTALHDAAFLAGNLKRAATGLEPKKYRPRHPVYSIVVGPRWAIFLSGKKMAAGYRGWRLRRQADMAMFKAFEPYKKAIKTWRKSNRRVRF